MNKSGLANSISYWIMHVYVSFNPISGTYSDINQGRLTGEINIPQISVTQTTKLFAYIIAQCNQ